MCSHVIPHVFVYKYIGWISSHHGVHIWKPTTGTEYLGEIFFPPLSIEDVKRTCMSFGPLNNWLVLTGIFWTTYWCPNLTITTVFIYRERCEIFVSSCFPIDGWYPELLFYIALKQLKF